MQCRGSSALHYHCCMKESFKNLKAWKILEAIDRKQSITKASIELDLSLSNASKLIGKLEKDLGHRLVNRGARPLRLTEYAQKLMPTVRELLLMAEHLEDVASSLAFEKSHETIVFSLSTTSVSAHVLEFINEFKQERPGLEIELRTGLNHLAVKEGKADVVLVSYSPDDKDLIQLPCGHCFNFMVASPKYLQKYGSPRTIEELLNHRLILRRMDFYPECRTLFKGTLCFDLDRLELFEENGKDRKILRRFDTGQLTHFKKLYSSDYSSYVAALNGEGIAVDLPVSFLEERLRNGSLVPVLPGWHRSPWIKSLVFSSSAPRDSLVREFAEWYQEKELKDSVKRWTSCFSRYGIPIELS